MGKPEKVVHEFVESFTDYEAVLVCTNELPAWEADAAIRAFAIYQWSDATTPGNDSSLRHNESGTIIRHDGGVLAIEYGHETLSDALSDLFLALYQLGWRGAEVYHPTASMNELLGDMGRAIPANLDFDVRPADLGRISDSSEGQAFVDVASRLKANAGAAGLERGPSAGRATEGSELLDLFRTMEPAVGRSSVVNLIDDENEEGAVSEPLAVRSSARVVPTFAEDDGEPGVPNLDFELMDRSLSDNSKDVLDEGAPEPSSLKVGEPFIKKQDEIKPAIERLVDDLNPRRDGLMGVNTIADDEVADLKVNKQLAIEVSTMQAADIGKPCSGKPGLNMVCDAPARTFKVGNSVFCFDFPSDPLALDEIKFIADERRIPREQWVHIRPGSLKESVRWDVLGEIDLDCPWTAEKLVKVVMPSADTRLVSCILLALRQEAPFAGLRDVLTFAGLDPAEMVRRVSPGLPGAEVLFRHAFARGDLVRVADGLVQSLGSIALAPVGQAFVDLLADPTELSEEMQEAFTVRGMMVSPAQRLFVVHVDSFDGMFVTALAASLRAVVELQVKSGRCCVEQVVAENAPVVSEVEPEVASEVANAEVKEMLGSLLTLLQKNGITVPE